MNFETNPELLRTNDLSTERARQLFNQFSRLPTYEQRVEFQTQTLSHFLVSLHDISTVHWNRVSSLALWHYFHEGNTHAQQSRKKSARIITELLTLLHPDQSRCQVFDQIHTYAYQTFLHRIMTNRRYNENCVKNFLRFKPNPLAIDPNSQHFYLKHNILYIFAHFFIQPEYSHGDQISLHARKLRRVLNYLINNDFNIREMLEERDEDSQSSALSLFMTDSAQTIINNHLFCCKELLASQHQQLINLYLPTITMEEIDHIIQEQQQDQYGIMSGNDTDVQSDI